MGHRTPLVCAVIVALLLAIVLFAATRVAASVDPVTVCINHPAVVLSCAPITSVDQRDRVVARMFRQARRRLVLFTSFTDVAAARRFGELAEHLRPGVDCAAYYDLRPMDPDRHTVTELMVDVGSAMRTRPLLRRAVYMGRFPFIHTASTHYKVTMADDVTLLCGSGNWLRECFYEHDHPRATCEVAAQQFLAPSFLEFDVVLQLSQPVPQICDYLELIAQQRPWSPRSVHVMFADGCEFHVFPAGVPSRDGFMSNLVAQAQHSVTVMALSVWPTGTFRTSLADAVDRGCRVTLIGSAHQCSKSQQLLSRLNRCAAFHARWAYREWSPIDGLVHAKFMLIDRAVVLPSFNFSYKSVAGAVDDETSLVLRGAAAAAPYTAITRMIRHRTVPVDPPRDSTGDALLSLLSPLM